MVNISKVILWINIMIYARSGFPCVFDKFKITSLMVHTYTKWPHTGQYHLGKLIVQRQNTTWLIKLCEIWQLF